eukprot:6206038-Pleurochrysis_carterae.AAC.1
MGKAITGGTVEEAKAGGGEGCGTLTGLRPEAPTRANKKFTVSGGLAACWREFYPALSLAAPAISAWVECWQRKEERDVKDGAVPGDTCSDVYSCVAAPKGHCSKVTSLDGQTRRASVCGMSEDVVLAKRHRGA